MNPTRRTLRLFTTVLMLVTSLAHAQEATDEELPASQFLFENVRVFDGVSDGLSSPTSVLVENNLNEPPLLRSNVGRFRREQCDLVRLTHLRRDGPSRPLLRRKSSFGGELTLSKVRLGRRETDSCVVRLKI